MGDFFYSVCVFDYRGFCKNGGQCLKKHFQEICENKSCQGDSCLKRHPKNCIFFSTFGDCKFAEHCRYNHEGKNTHVMIKMKDIVKPVEILKSEITQLKVDNIEKEIKLKDMKKISEENDKLTKENQKFNKDNKVLKEKLSCIEDNSMYIRSYQCDECNFESEDRDTMIEHMTENHDDIGKEFYVHTGTLAFAGCCICKKMFYNTEDLDKHNKFQIQCSICNLCTAVENPEGDYCIAMDHC
jgi:hypothetical protein